LQYASQHDFGFIYQPSFAHSYTVTNDTEDLRQALAAAEARTLMSLLSQPLPVPSTGLLSTSTACIMLHI
jgi:hypothetical protein